MDCTRARSLFSEYADGVLDKETAAALEEHLSSCAECRKEARALQSLIQDLRSLPPVAPPTDFLRQLHKRMDRPSGFRRIVEKLFFPIKFKIPLQLAGAALAALLVFSIYTFQQEEYKIPGTPRSVTKEKAGEKRRVATADKALAPAEKPDARPVGLGKEERPIELTLVLGKAAPPRQAAAPATAPSFEGKSVDSVDRERQAPRPATQAAPSSPAEKAEDMGDPVRKAISASQGRILSVQPASILAEVPSDKLPSLLENLRKLGEVHVPPSMPSDETQGPVQVRVLIVAAE